MVAPGPPSELAGHATRRINPGRMRDRPQPRGPRPAQRPDVFGCGTGDRRHDGGGVGDNAELLRGCLVALRVPAPADAYRPRPPPLWQVSDAIARKR